MGPDMLLCLIIENKSIRVIIFSCQTWSQYMGGLVNHPRGSRGVCRVYTLRYTCGRLRSTPIVHLISETCANRSTYTYSGQGRKYTAVCHLYKGSCFRWHEDMWRAWISGLPTMQIKPPTQYQSYHSLYIMLSQYSIKYPLRMGRGNTYVVATT